MCDYSLVACVEFEYGVRRGRDGMHKKMGRERARWEREREREKKNFDYIHVS
jgi:hypothetical protein